VFHSPSKRMHFLLTNDDSHRSPLLYWIIDFLRNLGDLTIVLPAHEQSFKAKSLSAFGHPFLSEIDLHGHPAYTLEGSPADCVNIGIYHLCPRKPDLVVSGINAGLNAGAAFMLSSGTIGACLEGNIAGVPGLALSQAFDRETMKHYIAEYALPESVVQHLSSQTPRLLAKVLGRMIENPELLRGDTTWNVNFPYSAISDELVACSLGDSRYGSCYRREGASFSFGIKDVRESEDPNSDAKLLLGGRVTVTPIRPFEVGQLKEGDIMRW
jgi:5'-nucleotidase